MLDKLDQTIIMDLLLKGFRKTAALAFSLGVNDRMVRRRLPNIIEKEVVRVVAVPNIVSLGFEAWARIGIKVEPGSLNRVTRVLVEHPSVYFVVHVLGKFDIIISVYFDTIDRLTHFVDYELTKIRGILFTETMLLVSPRKYGQFSWPVPFFESKEKVLRTQHDGSDDYGNYQVGELDRRILDVMMEDGLIPPKSLKLRLGVGEQTIRRHLRTMSQKEMFKLEVVPVKGYFEYEVQATTGINISHEFPHRVIDAIVENPAVILASVTLGRFNLVIVTRFADINLLNQFVTTVLPSIPGVSSTETFLHVKRLKYYKMTWPIP